MRYFSWCLSLIILSAACGCGSNPNKIFMSQDRLNSGLVMILPGIEGESSLNQDIRRGLMNGGCPYAMTIYHWGRPVPLAGPLLNQVDILGNRIEGKEIANRIVTYRKNYPDRPVYVIGHSGGGGIAVFAAEAMPKDVSLDGVVLLSASVSSAYDLTHALGHCRQGILNIYAPSDVGLLIIGTTLAGNMDGIRGPAAGAIGFDRPNSRASSQKAVAYQKLFQMELTTDEEDGSVHNSTTRHKFITHYVLPWLTATTWPPPEVPGAASTAPPPVPANNLAASSR
jgi:pimeloyl-ACP methyl ester carboxylesterase